MVVDEKRHDNKSSLSVAKCVSLEFITWPVETSLLTLRDRLQWYKSKPQWTMVGGRRMDWAEAGTSSYTGYQHLNIRQY